MAASEFEQELERINRIRQTQRKEAHNLLKQNFDPAKDLTPDQIEMLLKWGDTLHYLRQLPPDTQARALGHLINQEQVIREALGEVQVTIVRNWLQRDKSGQSYRLCYGSIAQERPEVVDPFGNPDGRFGYEFVLTKGDQTNSLIVFFRGNVPLSAESIENLEMGSMYPTSVLDFAQERRIQPFPFFGNPVV